MFLFVLIACVVLYVSLPVSAVSYLLAWHRELFEGRKRIRACLLGLVLLPFYLKRKDRFEVLTEKLLNQQMTMFSKLKEEIKEDLDYKEFKAAEAKAAKQEKQHIDLEKLDPELLNLIQAALKAKK